MVTIDWVRRFDQRVMDYLQKPLKKESGIDLRNDKMAIQRLKEAAEKAKSSFQV